MGEVNERIYTMRDIEALPQGQRAELIEGHIYRMGAPKRVHQMISMAISAIVFNHIQDEKLSCEAYAAPFGVWPFGDESTYLELDFVVVCDKDKLDDDGCKGAPDFVIEIASPSDTKEVMRRKFQIYHRAGVKEYWVIHPSERTVLTYVFEPELMSDYYTTSEDIPVNIFPGFTMNLAKLGL